MSLLQGKNVGVKMSLEDKLEKRDSLEPFKILFLPWGATQSLMNHRVLVRDKKDENVYRFAKDSSAIAIGVLFDFYKTFVTVAYLAALYAHFT
jgi:hypothetical protein